MAMTQEEAVATIAGLMKDGARLDHTALVHLRRILTNEGNTNPRAILHDGQVYAFCDCDTEYAVWDQKALEKRDGCIWIPKDQSPWDQPQPLLVEDGFTLEEIEQAQNLIENLS